MKVYFIPGLGANCKCFKYIKLPERFEKAYVEWLSPDKNETLNEYAHKIAKNIDTSKPFILVGYSFGGVIVQEMNKFIKPEKTILIASMKDSKQIPNLFKIVKKIKFADWFPMSFFTSNKIMSYAFMRSLYFSINSSSKSNKGKMKIEEYKANLNADYFKWSIKQIVTWASDKECQNLFQIHGTKDIIFPYKKIYKSYMDKNSPYLHTIDKGSHILVLEYPKRINKAFEKILLEF